ncbi:hypothetical protein SAPIO_CDS2995 [Scedosporium apiospermum]|uniref:Trafficking protein particle complex subunit 6B n=1 Tax=Pseudallescheria apiosperma TaxID=563466 RepID=A0A084GC03_PSEDA|nr:uncharacterized protein SAPIO_CDS2995 [Scedosporium apiospermum]KEZ44865.1 hypothetical protein SAPIO_CDS2995 [Scedosporium apiospermum]
MPPYNSTDPTATFLNVSCFDFLLIELVPLAYRITNELEPEPEPSSNGDTSNSSPPERRVDEEEKREAAAYRLDMLGYRVGQGIVERFARDRPRFNDTLDVIKFICKDLWSLVFRKQIDNLKTNHSGVFVLTDNSFRPLSRMSTEAGGQAVVRAAPFLLIHCGIIRGALAAMGINARVHTEDIELPAAIFRIITLPQKS